MVEAGRREPAGCRRAKTKSEWAQNKESVTPVAVSFFVAGSIWTRTGATARTPGAHDDTTTFNVKRLKGLYLFYLF